MPERRRETGGHDDRRQDEGLRDRVDELAFSYARAVEDQWRWLQRIAVALGIIAVAALLSGPAIYGLLQGQRLEATRSSCLAKNQTADSTVKLLISLGVRPQVTQLARKTYPRERDCEAYSRLHVTGWVFFSGKPIATSPPPMLTPAEAKLCGTRCVR